MLTITSVALFFLLLTSASAQPSDSPSSAPLGPDAVDLGTAGDFAILTKTGVTTTGLTTVTGDIGTSPIAAAAITGFALVMDSTNTFSTSGLVTGKVYAADYAPLTPTKMTTAIGDLGTAITDAEGRTLPDEIELGAGAIGGLTLSPGLYKWSSSVGISGTDVTFDGGADDVWILQIAQSLIVDSNKKVILAGGAQAKNIFWQITGTTTLEVGAHVEGVILCKTGIVFKTGSSLNGRALAQTAVTLDAATVVQPSAARRRLRGLGF